MNYSFLKLITKADQIVPYFVMDTLGSIPGLSGLFVAGVFSASLRYLKNHYYLCYVYF